MSSLPGSANNRQASLLLSAGKRPYYRSHLYYYEYEIYSILVLILSDQATSESKSEECTSRFAPVVSFLFIL